ncbi:MAG: SusC/RagA family TonB-linked outer membrane protein, partial [Bacteroidales bacterium]
MTSKKNILYLILLISTISFSQTRTITGTVISKDDKYPIPGATAIIEGTTKGTATDIDGNFKLDITPEDKVLVVSFVGMRAQKITIGEQSSFTIVLETETVGIEEVVITVPYGVQKKESFTGSVGLLQSDQLQKAQAVSVEKMLQGNVTGVISNSTSGQPGGSSEVRIRGIGSINASSEPLYVIDGVPVNSGGMSELSSSHNILSTLNPADIESISVLKDAAATSLYGSRASNGVIMITTKKGKEGKTKYTVRTQQGVSTLPNHKLEMLNTAQYMELRKEAMVNAGYDSIFINENLGKDTANTNWFEEVYRLGYSQNYDVEASGGSDKTSFYMSGSYKNDKGIVIGTGLDRLTGRLNITHKANDNISFGAKVTAAQTRQELTHGAGENADPVTGAYLLAPNIPVKKNTGEYYFDNYTYNVIGINQLDENSNQTGRFIGNIFGEYKFLTNFRFKTINNIDYIVINENKYISPLTPDGKAYNGLGVRANTKDITKTSSNTISYDKTLKEVHSINILGGYEVQESENNSNSMTASNFPANDIKTLSAAAEPLLTKSRFNRWAIISYISNFQYNFRGKYYASASFRRDGSSRFSPNNKWANFWSIGGSWRIS